MADQPVAEQVGWSDAPDQLPRSGKGGSYAPDGDFHTALDKTFGPGRWEATGDFRTPAREAALRMQGAGTVAPGHTSAHSLGMYGAAGAHDIVLSGVSRERGEAMILAIPGVKSVKWEGPHGTQGAHFHVTMNDTTGWRDAPQEGWKDAPDQDVSGGKKVTTKDIAKRLGDHTKSPGLLETALKEPEDSPYRKRRIEATQSMEQGVKDFTTPGPDLATGLGNMGKGALEATGGAFGLLWSPFGAEVDAGAGKAIAKATANAPESVGKGGVDYSLRMPEGAAGDILGNVAGFLVPGAEGAMKGLAGDAGGVLKTAGDRLRGKGRGAAPAEPGRVDPAAPAPPEPAPPEGEKAPPQEPTKSDESAAVRAARGRAKRAAKMGVASPDEVRRMQDRNPSPVTHPEPEEGAVQSAEHRVPDNLDMSHPSFDRIKAAAERGGYRVEATEAEPFRNGERRWVVKVDPEVPSWWKKSSHPRMAEWYDPAYAHETENGYVALNDPSSTEFPVQEKEPGFIWRGMSWEEYQAAQQAGVFRSKGTHNIGPGQKGLTYYSRSPRQASTYANGFAPWEKAGTTTHPPVVVKIRDPGTEVKVGGTDPDEVGIPGEVPIDHTAEVYFGRAITSRSGNFDVTEARDYSTGETTPKVGSSTAPASHVVWERQPDARATITDRENRVADAPDPNEAKVGSGFHTPEQDAAVERELKGKDVQGIAEYVAKRNTGRPMEVIAQAAIKAVQRLEAAGMKFTTRIVNVDDYKNNKSASDPQTARDILALRQAYGLMQLGAKDGVPHVTILYRGGGWGPAGSAGLHDSTLLHEIIHGVTSMALHAGRSPVNAGTDLAMTVTSLDRLTNHVIKAFNALHDKGEAPFHIGAVENADELLAYGFTNEPFQRWLETIPYAAGNAWSTFVDSIRKLLGLPAGQHTALSSLIRHGEALMNEVSADEIMGATKDVMEARGREGTFEKINPRKPGDRPMTHEEDRVWTDGGKAPMPSAGGGGRGGGGKPPSKGGYGGSGFGPGDIPPPGSDMHRGPVVGNEPDPVVKMDNALYRVGGAATADKLEALDFLKGVSRELSDPKVQEELSREIEKQIVDPGHQIPDHLRAAYEAFARYRDEVRDTVNRLRARRDDTLDPFLPETGYTPRRVKGHTPSWDASQGPQTKETDVSKNFAPSKRNLSPSTGSLNERTAGWMVPDWKTGDLSFTTEKPPEGSNFRIATMDEVEANTDIRYYRNPLINTLDEALRLRRVERNVQVLDHIKKTMASEGMAYHFEWRTKDPNGGFHVYGPGEHQIPEGFVRIDNIPQLKGWAFQPEVAEVFHDYYPPPGTSLDNLLTTLNRGLIGTLFITPIPHILNVAAHAWTGRGWDWMDIPGMAKGDLAAIPRAYVNGFTSSLQAIHEVWTKGPLYRDMMREGAGMMYGDTQVRNFLNVMLERAGHEITGDPQTFAEFSRHFDLKSFGIKTAKDLTRLLYDKSNKSMWLVNDMFLMQRIIELQKKGMDMRKAIFEAERDIPNYRIPSRVMGSRGLSEFMKGRNAIVFGRYKYGQWKALSGMLREFIEKSSSPEERLDALGKILVTGITMAAIFPAMDMALQKFTGNKDARVRRAGPFAILDAIAQFHSGEKDFPLAASSMFSPSPAIMAGIQAYENRDFFGKPVVQSATPLGTAVQLFEFASDPIYPLKTAEEFAKPGGGTRAVGRMFGLDIPPAGAKDKQASYKARDKAAATKREARDPLEQGIKKMLGGGGAPTESEDTSDLPPPDPNEKDDFKLGPIP